MTWFEAAPFRTIKVWIEEDPVGAASGVMDEIQLVTEMTGSDVEEAAGDTL